MSKSAKNPKHNNPMVLCASSGPGHLAGSRVDNNGQPIKSYIKDLIRVGDWVAGDVRFSVTPETLDHWTDTFAAMQKAGVKVPLPNGHNSDADLNRGYVTDMFHDGTTLFGRVDAIGEDAIKTVSRAEVSIYVPPTLKSGDGQVFDSPIAHVALTPVPVIPGQGPFVSIAASRVPVFTAAQDANSGASSMDALKQIAAALSLSIDGMDQAAATAAIVARVKSDTTSLACARDEKQKAEQALTLARAESGKKPEEFSPQVLKLSRQSRELVLGQLVKDGKISPAVRDDLHKAWVGSDGAALKLSLDAGQDALFDATIAALQKNSAKALAEATGSQVIALARPADGDSKPLTQDEINARSKTAYGKTG